MKKFKFTIGMKIGAGFSILIVSTVIVFVLTTITIIKSKKTNDELMAIYTPSVTAMESLNLLIVRSKMLIYNWVFYQSGSDNKEKQNLIELIDKEYLAKRIVLLKLAEYWSKEGQAQLNTVFDNIDSLFLLHSQIMNELNSFKKYEYAMIIFTVRPMVQEGGKIDVQTSIVLERLAKLIRAQQSNSATASDNMIASFSLLKNVVYISGIILICGGIIIAFFTISSIVKPVYKLRDILLSMAKGILPNNVMHERSDEIGEMSLALEKHMQGLKSTIEFSSKVGSGNFNVIYEPLSDKDILGHTLLQMRDNLSDLTNNLEAKVQERTEEVVQEKEKVEEANQKIRESIDYSQRIQSSIVLTTTTIQKFFPQSFIYYKPRDVVSGDFPWYYKKGDAVYIAAVDCTGHGVPGALLSFIAYFLLNEVVSHSSSNPCPSVVLDLLNVAVKRILNQKNSLDTEMDDGMDIALCRINLQKSEMQYAGAYRPLYYIHKGKLTLYKGDRRPIGGIRHNGSSKFTNYSIKINKGDSIFFFSDGLPDQFGGNDPEYDQYSTKRIQEIILQNQNLTMSELAKKFEEDYENFKGSEMQTDDVLLIGVRF